MIVSPTRPGNELPTIVGRPVRQKNVVVAKRSPMTPENWPGVSHSAVNGVSERLPEASSAMMLADPAYQPTRRASSR